MLDAAFGGVALHRVGLNVSPARFPRPGPGVVVNDHGVGIPTEAGVTPAPGCECRADGDAAAEADGSADEDAGTRGSEDDQRIVEGYVVKAGIHGCDRDVRPGRHHDLRTGPQIAV